jgi:hypothetical protein
MLACGLIVAAAVSQAVFTGCTAPGADDRIRTATVREGAAAGPVTVVLHAVHSTPGDLRQLTLRFEAGAPSRVSAVLLSQPD